MFLFKNYLSIIAIVFLLEVFSCHQLEYDSIKSNNFKLFKQRSQFVLIVANRSKTGMLSFGVPQGSILGPIIFNLYSNDLQDTLNSDALQYADDTTTYVSAKPKDLELAVIGTRSSLNNLDQWANENNLTTNVIKTKCMLFSTKRLPINFGKSV